jgi:predicted O-methyltransferase YrrM
VTSLEHDEEYAEKTNAMLRLHGLTEWATVLHAPLVQLDIAGHPMLWYDPKVTTQISEIDVLVVDGPPGRVAPLARFPALPRLESQLNSGAIILADDASRPAENEMVKRWSGMYPNLTSEYHPTEKGAFTLYWPKA